MFSLLLLPFIDYFTMRKKLWGSYIVPLVPSALFLVYTFKFNVNEDIDLSTFFDAFINTEISTIAILISFSVAILTILATADNANIKAIKSTISTDFKNFKAIGDGSPTLFQILLSSATYNVYIQIFYLLFLIGEIFLQLVIPVYIYKYLTTINIYFLVHILLSLLQTVSYIYFVFWKNREASTEGDYTSN